MYGNFVHATNNASHYATPPTNVPAGYGRCWMLKTTTRPRVSSPSIGPHF